MITNMNGGGSAPTYETCEITFAGDFGTEGSGKCTYEDEHGEFQTVSLNPYPDSIKVRKNSGIYFSNLMYVKTNGSEYKDSLGYDVYRESSIYPTHGFLRAVVNGTITLTYDDDF